MLFLFELSLIVIIGEFFCFYREIIDKYGVGVGGIRNIFGISSYYEILEKKLVEIYKKEVVLFFIFCYVVNDIILFILVR